MYIKCMHTLLFREQQLEFKPPGSYIMDILTSLAAKLTHLKKPSFMSQEDRLNSEIIEHSSPTCFPCQSLRGT